MNTEPEANQIPTEWHALTFLETQFAQTHAAKIIRETFIQPDKLPPSLQADIVSETRDLLFVHRGTVIAAWIMEHAKHTGKIPGHAGKLAELQPGVSEARHLAESAAERGESKPGPRPPSDAMTIDELFGTIRKMTAVKRVYMDVGGQLVPVRFVIENDKMVVIAAINAGAV